MQPTDFQAVYLNIKISHARKRWESEMPVFLIPTPRPITHYFLLKSEIQVSNMSLLYNFLVIREKQVVKYGV